MTRSEELKARLARHNAIHQCFGNCRKARDLVNRIIGVVAWETINKERESAGAESGK